MNAPTTWASPYSIRCQTPRRIPTTRSVVRLISRGISSPAAGRAGRKKEGRRYGKGRNDRPLDDANMYLSVSPQGFDTFRKCMAGISCSAAGGAYVTCMAVEAGLFAVGP
jgi:hypothetical protein